MNMWIVRLVTLLCVLLCVWPGEISAGLRKKKKQTEKETLTSYEKLFEGKNVETAKGDWILLHKVDGKVYVEYLLEYVGRDVLIASTVTSSTNGMLCMNGYKENQPMHLKVVLEGDNVIFKQVNALMKIDTTDVRMREIKRQNFEDPSLFKYEILAFSPDSSSVVFDMTALFLDREKALHPLPAKTMGYSLGATINEKLSSIRTVKAFDDNASVSSQLVYRYSLKNHNDFAVYQGALTVMATRSILLLPERKMHPRVSDSRIGTFLTSKEEFTEDGKMLKYTFANRWDLQPKDEEAFRRGEMVEPEKPIVFYMDTLFPPAWKQPIRKGVLRWNQAFEKIGFKNAVQVRDFPKKDPKFDPDNLNYSCIRYIPQPEGNAMGPSWVDPETGEILNAGVFIYSNVVETLRDWRFVQTAQVDEGARSKKLSGDLLDESLSYMVAHEIGHCLGLKHNMAASYAYPVDSLRSPSFTQKYGTTPSIMDYARFNYVAQPGDKGVCLTPPDLGVYDEFAIQWLYTPIDATDPEEEKKILKSWIDDREGDLRYRYGCQQVRGQCDPSALEEDLGDDAIKAGDYGVRNLKYILPNLQSWIQDDENFNCRQQLYRQIVSQYVRYIHNVLANVGGIYLNERTEDLKQGGFVPVASERQRESMLWVMNQLHDLSWLNDKELLNNMPVSTLPSLDVVEVVGGLISRASIRVVLAASWSESPYSLADFFEDFYCGVWDSAIQGRRLTPEDKVLQRIFLKQVEEQTRSFGSNPLWLTGDTWFRNPLESLGMDDDGLREIDVRAINEISTYYYEGLEKLKMLLESRMQDFHDEDKAYYSMVLYAVKQMLGQQTYKN